MNRKERIHMYDEFFVFETLYKQKEKDLERKSNFIQGGIATKKRPAICNLPILNQLPRCQCQ
jgi:hypothetical protein